MCVCVCACVRLSDVLCAYTCAFFFVCCVCVFAYKHSCMLGIGKCKHCRDVMVGRMSEGYIQSVTVHSATHFSKWYLSVSFVYRELLFITAQFHCVQKVQSSENKVL